MQGWLQRVDAEIIGAVLTFQAQKNIFGSYVEIDVHHGKSFVPLCTALRKDELALIDIFDDQMKNLDASGNGHLNLFQANLMKFRFDQSRICIYKGLSVDVRSEYVLEQVGRVRFFSVDGGHWNFIVRSDLTLAEMTLAAGGVVALDDYCRPNGQMSPAAMRYGKRTQSQILFHLQSDPTSFIFAKKTMRLPIALHLKRLFWFTIGEIPIGQTMQSLIAIGWS